MSKKFKGVREDELASLIDRALSTSINFYDNKLSVERREVLDYYNGVKPKPSHAGNSKYVSMDVFDAVESMKAVLLETFSAGHRIVTFDPQSEASVVSSKAATEYADYVIFRQNPGYEIFSTVIQDGLMARCGVVKVFWDDVEEDIVEEFKEATQEQVDALVSDPSVLEVSGSQDPLSGLWSGEITRKTKKNQVRVETIPPEEFLITPTAKSLKEAPVVAHRTKKSVSDLRKMFPEANLDEIGPGANAEIEDNLEVLSRTSGVSGDNRDIDGSVQEQSRLVWVQEVYMHLDLEGTGKTKLMKIIKCGNLILDKEEVECLPFKVFVPMPLAHAFYGSNYAHKVIPTQNARTVLVRGILDHTVATNNPRYQVVKGAVTNPKELLENRFGGLVNVTRPDGILPFPQASLNPFVFQTIQLLDDDKEEVTGVSRLSQGLNKDAVSKQNSQGLVENLVSLSQQREKIIARNFASFLRELYLEVYRLVLANEREEKVIQVAGDFIRIAPWEWSEQTTCTVEMRLGYGEQGKEAQTHMMLHQMLMSDPEARAMYPYEQRFNTYKTIYEKLGIKNVSSFMVPPQKMQPIQPDPLQVKQVELEERKVATQEVIAQAQAKKVDVNASLEQMRLMLDRMALEIKRLTEERSLDIKEFDSTSKAAIASEELALAKETAAAAPPQNEKTTAILSPN